VSGGWPGSSRRCRFLGRIRRLDEALEQTPDEIEALHRVRRALRRLRYAREWLGGKTRIFAELQETFGAVGDLSVALRLAQACPSKRPLAPYRKTLLAELETARVAALARWREVKRRLLRGR
jgi:uncharacterized protein YciW